MIKLVFNGSEVPVAGVEASFRYPVQQQDFA